MFYVNILAIFGQFWMPLCLNFSAGLFTMAITVALLASIYVSPIQLIKIEIRTLNMTKSQMMTKELTSKEPTESGMIRKRYECASMNPFSTFGKILRFTYLSIIPLLTLYGKSSESCFEAWREVTGATIA